MNNRTLLYYILSGPIYYQLTHDRSNLHLLKKEVEKEIEYFFEKRYIRSEPWNKRYFRLLTAVFSVNLLARHAERCLFKSHSRYGEKYSKFAPATLSALRVYNSNRAYFSFDTEPYIFLRDLLHMINNRVNSFYKERGCSYNTEFMIHANTPMGIEIEFTNKGATAGSLFESGRNDALMNFSKYHFYRLMKFMWRFGAYVDADMPFKQFLKRGGFLEYTFTRPDVAFKPSEPLTSSPRLAAQLINEAVRFTPVRPHSLHVTFELKPESKKLPNLPYNELIFMMLCTGHFVETEKGLKETRITERNMKDFAVIRDRRNDSGWVVTVEFTHMRMCRDFVRRQVYEPSLLLLLAYKNLFNFLSIDIYSRKLLDWAENPSLPDIDADKMLNMVKAGLDKEISLPEWYKHETIGRIKDVFDYNVCLIKKHEVQLG